jgi:hypothetical protein
MSTVSARQSPALPTASKIMLAVAFTIGILGFVIGFVFPYFLSSATPWAEKLGC